MQHRPGSLPGTEPSPKGLFIDLWGTLCELPRRGEAHRPEEVRFVPGALDALFRARRRGFNLYLIGNQASVAFGEVDDGTWLAIEDTLLSGLSGAGAELTRNYLCLVHPRGQGRRKGESVYHLPNTGAFYHAAHHDGLDLRSSWVIGDSTLELVAGWRAGLRLCGVRTGLCLSDRAYDVEMDSSARSLTEAIEHLLPLAPRLVA
jgi:D-glycero-D-manno-heptose 1,7-bisphosphate phosphatase